VDVLPEFANDIAKNIHSENKQLKELLEKVEVDARETKNRYICLITPCAFVCLFLKDRSTFKASLSQ
jgi:hypothetical protein